MKRKIIENYALNQVLGEGMYGIVYKASHLKTNQEFAVKVIPVLKFQENPKLEECTVNEIKILETIDRNQFIIRYIQMLKTSNNFYFVYEYCNGGTLEHKLRHDNYLPEKESLKIFRQLLEAFKVLNKYNIMHRDLKPDNIFFHDNNLKLGDFGFCKTLGKADDMASTMLGSPIYMAPQVLKGQAYTSKADIWSLGVVLYQMLFGVCPFQSNSIAKLITVLADTELRIPSQLNISQPTQNLLKKLLVKDQFKRIEWFDLLNYIISQDGVISEPDKFSTLQQLKQISSDRSITNNEYRQQNQSTTSLTSSSNNTGNELMFKKKAADPYSKSNTQLNRASRQYDNYSNGNTGIVSSNSPRKQKTQDVKTELSAISTPNLHKNMSAPEQTQSKRKFLLDQHTNCINAVKTAINFLKTFELNGLAYSLLLFKKVEEKLRRLCDSISPSESEVWDISTILSGQLKQVQRQCAEVLKETKNNNIDYSLIESPKQFLRQKYSNKGQVNTKLWYQLIVFLNDTRINPRSSNFDWENTIEAYVN